MLPQGLIGKLLCAIVDDFQWVIVDFRGHEFFTTKDYTATTININRLLSPPKGKFIKSVCAWFVCGCARCQRCCKVCWKYTLKNLAAIASTLFFMLQSYPRSLCLHSKVSLGNWTIFDDIIDVSLDFVPSSSLFTESTIFHRSSTGVQILRQ